MQSPSSSGWQHPLETDPATIRAFLHACVGFTEVQKPFCPAYPQRLWNKLAALDLKMGRVPSLIPQTGRARILQGFHDRIKKKYCCDEKNKEK